MGEDATKPTLRDLAQQMEALRAENRELRARLTALEGPPGPAPTHGPPAAPPPPGTTTGAGSAPTSTGTEPVDDGRGAPALGRRRLLRDGLLAGAAGVAATTAAGVMAGSPAAAVDGQPLLLGQENTATTSTRLIGGGYGATLEITDGSPINTNRRDEAASPFTTQIRAHITSPNPAMGVSNEEGIGLHVHGGRHSPAVDAYGGQFGVRARGTWMGVRAIGQIGVEGQGEIGVSGHGTKHAATFDSEANGITIRATASQLRLRPWRDIPAPPTTSDEHERGDIVLDATDALWFCVAGGTPGTWRKLSGTGTAGALHVLPAPARVYDSRFISPPTSVGPKTPFAAGETRTFDLRANGSTVPAGATAALVTLLLVNASTAPGNLTIWASGQPRPLANTMVWGGPAGRFSATAVTALDDQARAQVNVSQGTDLVIDVVGFYR